MNRFKLRIKRLERKDNVGRNDRLIFDSETLARMWQAWLESRELSEREVIQEALTGK